MYIAMRRYTVSEARMRLAEVLDHAERGNDVVIERRGARFKVVAARAERRRKPALSIKILDPAVEAGQWTWKWGRQGFSFVPGKTDKR
jgi:prevent-host-death family protein